MTSQSRDSELAAAATIVGRTSIKLILGTLRGVLAFNPMSAESQGSYDVFDLGESLPQHRIEMIICRDLLPMSGLDRQKGANGSIEWIKNHLSGSSRPCSRRDYVRMLMQRGTSLLTLNRKSKDMAALVKYARELTDNKNGRDEILIECVSLNTSFFAELNLDIAFPRIRTAKTSFCPSVHSLKCQRSLNSIPQAVCACFADAKIQPSLIQTKFQTSTPSFFDVRSKKTLVCIARGDDAGILPIHCIDLSTFRLGKQYRCMTSRHFSRPIIIVTSGYLTSLSKDSPRTRISLKPDVPIRCDICNINASKMYKLHGGDSVQYPTPSCEQCLHMLYYGINGQLLPRQNPR
ncbi:hypothetical protein SO694_0009005 [Aureococcus anophagefferens]|uniref:snRNA-activating protein complex subunit 3 n=1 Tax=Aureococcus anophagefferens TaxID=44056 RepID=A0ABR1FS98_AURAN|mmetsp:Transcript_3082/g.10535  ORF Transcript_3082/g.10535 Transcript_3082/m.10535 type:complete len:348 (-) Transcript_3082:1883-2926(-)